MERFKAAKCEVDGVFDATCCTELRCEMLESAAAI